MKKIAILLLIIVSLSGCGFRTVPVGHRGILTRFGVVEGDARTEGLYFYNPFTESMHLMDVRTLKWDGRTEAYTHDVQESTVSFTINFNLDPVASGTVFRTVGENWETILLAQFIHQRVKEVVAQWDAVDLIAHRPEVNQRTAQLIKESLAPKHVDVTNFSITDIQFSDNFNKAVEAKVIAQQNAVQEQNRTEQVKQQAAQVVIRATSEAQSMKIRADALAQNPKLVQWEAVQKWNGVLPVYVLSGAVPFISTGEGK